MLIRDRGKTTVKIDSNQMKKNVPIIDLMQQKKINIGENNTAMEQENLRHNRNRF